MSWSFSAIGTPKGVAAKIQYELDKKICSGPEEDARINIMSAAKALALGTKGDNAVKVEANGHASSNGDYCTQNAQLKVEPVYGFALDPVEKPLDAPGTPE